VPGGVRGGGDNWARRRRPSAPSRHEERCFDHFRKARQSRPPSWGAATVPPVGSIITGVEGSGPGGAQGRARNRARGRYRPGHEVAAPTGARGQQNKSPAAAGAAAPAVAAGFIAKRVTSLALEAEREPRPHDQIGGHEPSPGLHGL